jgi:putative inorganic carbon (HCO3(-)) transporter
MGFNTFRLLVPILYPLYVVQPAADIAHAHNHLLQVGLDLGIPGLVAYLAIWLDAAGVLSVAWRSSSQDWLRILTLGFAGSLLAYFIFGLTDTIALGARPGFMLWLLFGLAASLHTLVVSDSCRISTLPNHA